MKGSVFFATAAAMLLSGGLTLGANAEGRLISQDISFDGFCDGMRLNIDDGAGSRVVYGNRTGSCISADPVGGSRANLKGIPQTITAAVSASGSVVDFVFIIRPNRTWCNYAMTPTSLIQFNCGTWTPGVPALAKKGAKSSTGK